MSVQSEIERIRAGKEDIRAAIVEKGQSVPATAPLSAYGDKIRAIQTGTDTTDATAAAGDILSGKTAYVGGAKVTGTMAKATQATPSITVSSAGLITASAAQAAGYVASGTKSATKQLTTQAAQTITPGTANKTAVAAGRYTTGAVKVAGDANLVPENIRSGVSIFGVVGNYEAGGASVTVNTADDITFEVNYFNGSDFSATTDASFTTKGAMLVDAQRKSTGKPTLMNPVAFTVSGAEFIKASTSSLSLGSPIMCVPIDSAVTITIS